MRVLPLVTALLITVLVPAWRPEWCWAQGRSSWKENRAPEFKDFPVQAIHQGAPAAVDLTSHPQARMYRTQLRRQALKGPDFAGHYTVAEWGCGSNCQSHMIVDAKTGRVYSGLGSERGISIRLDSNLLIADPPMGPSGFAYPDNPTDSLPVRYYVWEDHNFRLIYEEPCTVVDKRQVCGRSPAMK